jgi:hypothetical protein
LIDYAKRVIVAHPVPESSCDTCKVIDSGIIAPEIFARFRLFTAYGKCRRLLPLHLSQQSAFHDVTRWFQYIAHFNFGNNPNDYLLTFEYDLAKDKSEFGILAKNPLTPISRAGNITYP